MMESTCGSIFAPGNSGSPAWLDLVGGVSTESTPTKPGRQRPAIQTRLFNPPHNVAFSRPDPCELTLVGQALSPVRLLKPDTARPLLLGSHLIQRFPGGGRLHGVEAGIQRQRAFDQLPAALDISGSALDHSLLAIQGPPGLRASWDALRASSRRPSLYSTQESASQV